MSTNKFSNWPSFTKEELDAVQKVLKSNRVNYWTGCEGKRFEEEFSKWCGVNYAISLSNGSVALDLALRALDIKPGDEVIVSPRTFIASVSCIVNIGAVPVFADVDSNSGTITSDTIKKVTTSKSRALICVHLAGWPCDMDPIMDLAKKQKFFVIEDCAQAHGAAYNGKSVGSIGDIAAWSFCQDKIMTTGGEGGMVTTNDHHLFRRMWSYKDHGKVFETRNTSNDPFIFQWLHDSFGTNYRMTEMQAVIGRIQLKKMSSWHSARKKNATAILNTCSQFSKLLRVPTTPVKSEHAYYKCYVYIKPEGLKSGWSRDHILREINDRGVSCYSGSCSEVYLEKAFDATKYRPNLRLPIAKELGETSLMFLVHPTLTQKNIDLTCEIIKEVMHLASG